MKQFRQFPPDCYCPEHGASWLDKRRPGGVDVCDGCRAASVRLATYRELRTAKLLGFPGVFFVLRGGGRLTYLMASAEIADWGKIGVSADPGRRRGQLERATGKRLAVVAVILTDAEADLLARWPAAVPLWTIGTSGYTEWRYAPLEEMLAAYESLGGTIYPVADLVLQQHEMMKAASLWLPPRGDLRVVGTADLASGKSFEDLAR